MGQHSEGCNQRHAWHKGGCSSLLRGRNGEVRDWRREGERVHRVGEAEKLPEKDIRPPDDPTKFRSYRRMLPSVLFWLKPTVKSQIHLFLVPVATWIPRGRSLPGPFLQTRHTAGDTKDSGENRKVPAIKVQLWLSTSPRARFTVRPSNTECQRFGAKKGLLQDYARRMGGSCLRNPKLPKDYQQSIF